MDQKEARLELENKLVRWFVNYHPLNLLKPELIEREVGEATDKYNRLVGSFGHSYAMSEAKQHLLWGYQFSPYQMLMDVLEEEFEDDLPELNAIRYIAVELLKTQKMQDLLAQFQLFDDFEDEYQEEWEKLWYGMIDVTRELFDGEFDQYEFWDNLVQSDGFDDYLHPLF